MSRRMRSCGTSRQNPLREKEREREHVSEQGACTKLVYTIDLQPSLDIENTQRVGKEPGGVDSRQGTGSTLLVLY